MYRITRPPPANQQQQPAEEQTTEAKTEKHNRSRTSRDDGWGKSKERGGATWHWLGAWRRW